MDFFEIVSVISLVLSGYLTIHQIYNSTTRTEIDILAQFNFSDSICLKISVNNLSSNPVAITEASLSNRVTFITSKANYFNKTIATVTRKTNGEVTGFDSIIAEGVPINLQEKSARAFYLSFPVEEEDLNSLIQNNITLNLKINGKYRSVIFDPNSKSFPREQLQKELGRK